MGIFSDLTVEENMALAAASGPISDERLAWLFKTFPPLKTFWNNAAGNLSGGQKQMLSIARAMAEERRLYLIDEPTKGLRRQLSARWSVRCAISKRKDHRSFWLNRTSPLPRRSATACAVMDDGRIVWSGAMAELAGDADLQERLMGLSMEAA